jgi:hypothetical protein
MRCTSGYTAAMAFLFGARAQLARAALAVGACLAASVFLNAVAAAQTGIEAHADPGLIVGAKIGGSLGAPFNDLGASPTVEVELGYLLPLPQPIGHAFELFIAGSYSAPGLREVVTTMDPRLPGDGSFTYDVRQHFFALEVGALFRVPLPTSLLSPYAAIGYRGTMIDTRVRGTSDGQAFGDNHEFGYEHGMAFAAGVDIYLGPGALLAELQFNYAGRDAFVFRDTNYDSLGLMVGYRLMFGSADDGGHPAKEPTIAPKKPVEPKAAPAAETSIAPEPIAPPPTDVVPAPADVGPATGSGQIRGTVRSFSGEAVQATITVYPIKQKAKTDAAGDFSMDVPPGRYSVRVRASKYKSQSRDVLVTENGVTVLNVELGQK